MICYHEFSKRFGDIVAVDRLDLAVASGELVALIGPNGSGKTTTLKALVGLVRPTAGHITIGGCDAAAAEQVVRAGLGYLPQRLTFPEGATACEVMQLYARLRGVHTTEVDDLLERVRLSDVARRAVDSYSGGMRQRLGLAIALLGRPRALVLDEPSATLDPTGALLVRDLLRDIRAEGTTVLLSSHDLAEVAALADRVAIFVAGRLRAIGSVAALEAETGVCGLEAVYRALVLAAPSGPGKQQEAA